MKLIIYQKNEKILDLQLKKGTKLLGQEYLTIGQNLDNMLIRTIDKLAVKTRISRLSLKNVQIQGKMRPEAVSTMVIKTVGEALEV